jgi:hypothetical protein
VAGLAPTTEKGRSAEGWGHTAVVALAAMPTRARATMVTPVTRSWEEEAAWTVAIATAKAAGATMAVAEATETMSTAPNEPSQGRPVVAVVTMMYNVRDFIGSKHMGLKQIEPRWILGGLEVME